MKKINNVWVGAIPVSGEIQEWLQSLIVRLNWLNESSQQMTFSSPEYRWTTSLNKKGCLLFATLVTISCLTNRCFHSHWYFILPLWDTLLTIPTSKKLRYKLLTFAIFIIQSQVGVIPVFSRLCGFSHRVVEISYILHILIQLSSRNGLRRMERSQRKSQSVVVAVSAKVISLILR